MQKMLLVVIAVGAAVGFMTPDGKPEPVEAEAAETGGLPRETVVERAEDGHFYVDANVNGQLVHFLVDTGATGVALTEEDAKRIGLPIAPEEYTVVGTGASGPVQGQTFMLNEVELDGKRATEVEGAVLQGLEISLLGQAYLSQIGSVEMNGDFMRLK